MLAKDLIIDMTTMVLCRYQSTQRRVWACEDDDDDEGNADGGISEASG